MAKHGKEINSTACGSMPYADATVKEVLRIETIVGEVYRRALKTFECGGYTIPKVLNIGHLKVNKPACCAARVTQGLNTSCAAILVSAVGFCSAGGLTHYVHASRHSGELVWKHELSCTEEQ